MIYFDSGTSDAIRLWFIPIEKLSIDAIRFEAEHLVDCVGNKIFQITYRLNFENDEEMLAYKYEMPPT